MTARPRALIHRGTIWAVAPLMLLGLTSCGDNGGGQTGESTTPNTPTSGDAPQVTLAEAMKVPDAPITLQWPADWIAKPEAASWAVVAPKSFSGSDFKPNVVVSTTDCTQSLTDTGTTTTDYLKAREGWTADSEGQGETTAGGLPSYFLSGRQKHDSGEYAQAVTVVQIGAGSTCRTVVIAGSSDIEDATGSAQVKAIVGSMKPVT